MNENTNPELTENFWATLKKYPKPIQVIIGDYPKSSSKWNNIDAGLPYLKLQEVDNAGSHIWIDQPQKFENYVGNPLSRIAN